MTALVIAEPTLSAEQSYWGLIITGGFTVLVALIGLAAAKSRKSEATNPSPLPKGEEDQWIKDLRGEVMRRRRNEERLRERARHLERILLVWDIDPETGRRLPNAEEAFPFRSPHRRGYGSGEEKPDLDPDR